MLIPFYECLKHCPTNIKGIIHIGAHDLEEKFDYELHSTKNILWIEAMADKVEKYKKDNKIYQIVVSDKDDDEIDFKITNNGQSSSILNFGTHSKYHPDVKVIDTIKLKTTRIDTFIAKENIDIKEFNFCALDIQGVELKALKSFGKLLEYIDYVYTEVNDEEVYIGCDLISDIDSYLKTFNFKRVITKMTACHWGDSFYVKN